MRSNFLSGKCCIDCGESDPIVLEFDHIIESEKCFNIADAIAHNYSEKSLIEEMDKCEIRCANCHRRRHYFNNAGKWSG
jgi:L-lysine 2,3-aminomutase